MDTHLATARRAYLALPTPDPTAARYVRALERALGLATEPPRVVTTAAARFNGRAQRQASVETLSDGTVRLLSYGTPVSYFQAGVLYQVPPGTYSNTTTSHQSKWARELGYPKAVTVPTDDPLLTLVGA